MIAITGFSGFIGQHLCKHLNLRKCLLLGRKPIISKNADAAESDNELLGTNPLHLFYPLDLTDISNINLVEQLSNVTTFIHIAAQVPSNTSAISASQLYTINTNATLMLAKQAAQAGVKRFIFLSSIKVNGEVTLRNKPFTQNDTPFPEDDYSKSKLSAEQQLMQLGKEMLMEIVIIRPPLVYGEGVKGNFASLFTAVQKGWPLPFRAITNKRSLVSVYNLVDLITVCIEHPNAANQVFLVSDDNDLSIANMVSLMAKISGRTNISLPIPLWCLSAAGTLLGKNEALQKLVGSLQADISHTKQMLNWSAPYTVEHGFRLAGRLK